MARLMQHYLQKSGEKRIILVATSGDTGSAVADGFAGQANIEVVLLYPKGKVSDVQERQLVAVRPGVRSFAVEGSFDDCQRMVKEAFGDPGLAHLPLSSANSINIGRLLPQMLYYLWTLAQVKNPIFCVPSGNLGNLTAGIFAALSSHQTTFIAAHNANDFFPKFLQGQSGGFNPTIATVSNAMDVGSPSNFERLQQLLGDLLADWVWATSVSDDKTLQRIHTTYQQYGYTACPHTAVGLEAAALYQSQHAVLGPVVSLACAHPAKFPAALAKAGVPVPRDGVLEALLDRPTQYQVLPASLEALKVHLA
jgi:threonine synthase